MQKAPTIHITQPNFVHYAPVFYSGRRGRRSRLILSNRERATLLEFSFIIPRSLANSARERGEVKIIDEGRQVVISHIASHSTALIFLRPRACDKLVFPFRRFLSLFIELWIFPELILSHESIPTFFFLFF